MKGIIGVEIPIDRDRRQMEGQPEPARGGSAGVVAGLRGGGESAGDHGALVAERGSSRIPKLRMLRSCSKGLFQESSASRLREQCESRANVIAAGLTLTPRSWEDALLRVMRVAEATAPNATARGGNHDATGPGKPLTAEGNRSGPRRSGNPRRTAGSGHLGPHQSGKAHIAPPGVVFFRHSSHCRAAARDRPSGVVPRV